MARIQGFVRTGTLKKQAAEGLVERIEVIVADDGASVHVHYRPHVKGDKERLITAYRREGPRQFASLDSVWKLVESLGLKRMMVSREDDDL